ncbi:MAG: heavy-metal-associated domain-containing protein [Runella slithyformis]|nr:MAG: heavy-metal-associated domain-containing protein [Runella slithyformis]TAF97022.1 MAG: heavy-metal-associated domain-containing protein [Runella sp.]TAG21507.1 MAG: heavy-metal-associated domain-containing protein [Cytophagales bacterium]TAG40806.1 MAG: heavy-metal-associated domain-containing protein [Cytophagia bacterium]TAF29178.1 MAG: heavy-metal-associated domain-containing protein [Runella slithyformis]
MGTTKSPITQSLIVTGMTCQACEYKIKHVFGQIAGVENVQTNLQTGEVTVESEREVRFEELEAVLKPYPKYKVPKASTPANTAQADITKFGNESRPSSNQEQLLPWYRAYYPLLLIVAFITGVSVITAYSSDSAAWGRGTLHNFMTGFFLVFSFFKLLDVRAFANSFQMYDLLAARSRAYALAYPFIELALGVACLLHFQPRYVYMADIVIMGFGAMGVIQSVLDKRKIQCACLGSVFNLPMSTVTIIENTVMVLIGIALLML